MRIAAALVLAGRPDPAVLALLLVLTLVTSLLGSGYAHASNLDIKVKGVEGAAAENIRAHLSGGLLGGAPMPMAGREDEYLEKAQQEARIALRPFGYYQPIIKADVRPGADADQWHVQVDVQPGPPILVETVNLQLTGPGAEQREFLAWKDNWPLSPGARLIQPDWTQAKRALADLAEELGFLKAQFTEQRIELDLERQQAALILAFHTGQRAVMGTVRFEQDFLDGPVLAAIPRFKPGDPYQARYLEQLRTDLWKLGYFRTIEVSENPVTDHDPPVVNLHVLLKESHSVTHQGTLGYGTDTEFRTQYRWQKHVISHRGDSLSTGFGWQSRDNEFQVLTEYRLPRQVDSHQYWLGNAQYRSQNETIELDFSGMDDSQAIARGRVDDLFLRGGRARLRNPSQSEEQLVETIFVQYLIENGEFQLFDELPVERSVAQSLLPTESSDSLAIGMEWDWPVINGTGFRLHGHRHRAWLFTSNEAWGSDADFTQAYLSSRWNIPLGDRWRLILRGEAGYSDARVRDVVLDLNDREVTVSLTELPFRYRFRAGGSFSVRGYEFESLSNNSIGSNNLLTASAEIEFEFRDNWSVVAFTDTGNAFNDWSDTQLSTGYGVGLRWYTMAFPLRLDFAKAQSLDGEPWRVHFTIGSQLF